MRGRLTRKNIYTLKQVCKGAQKPYLVKTTAADFRAGAPVPPLGIKTDLHKKTLHLEDTGPIGPRTLLKRWRLQAPCCENHMLEKNSERLTLHYNKISPQSTSVHTSYATIEA